MADNEKDIIDEILEDANPDEAAQTAEEKTEAEAASEEQGAEAPAEEEKKQDAGEGGTDKKGFFGKFAKKDKRDEQIEELTDRLRRNLAEFDNYRKRTDREKSSMYEMGVKGTVEKILPVVDSLERGLAAIPEDQKEGAVAQGMDKIYKQFMKILDDMDVKAIEAVGTEFNPDRHNAVMHIEDESLGENVVAEEFQKGYEYHGSVIRHSMVKVAN